MGRDLSSCLFPYKALGGASLIVLDIDNRCIRIVNEVFRMVMDSVIDFTKVDFDND